jgi:hypothetical protein
MKSPDDSEREEIGETVDRRLFDDEGNVREDVAEARDEEPEEEELTVELLERQVIQAMEQVGVTFQQMGQQIAQLTQQVQTAISDMHVRLGVLEELNVNPDLAQQRQDIQDGVFKIEHFKKIAEEVVLPAMNEKAAKLRAKMKAQFEKLQAMVAQGMSPEEAQAKLQADAENETTPEEGDSGIEIVSG